MFINSPLASTIRLTPPVNCDTVVDELKTLWCQDIPKGGTKLKWAKKGEVVYKGIDYYYNKIFDLQDV